MRVGQRSDYRGTPVLAPGGETTFEKDETTSFATRLEPSGLVGRTRELAAIDRALDALSTNAGSVLAVAGEPGIGKTALLEELCDRADARELLVLSGRAAEFEGGVPFAAFVDALDDYLGSLNPRLFERLDRGTIGELAAVFGSMAELGEDPAPGLPDERYRSHRAVGALLELLANRRPLVLALDDVQWADDASIELLSHLLRRRPAGRCCSRSPIARARSHPGWSPR